MSARDGHIRQMLEQRERATLNPHACFSDEATRERPEPESPVRTAFQRDRDRILDALERAQLAELVADLEEGIDTLVGDRGSRLSGGQRQRVGIARALYRDPRVIVLDEATSALDNETEHRITSTLRALHGEITTILVAHRLSTVRHVDALAYLERGRVRAVGSFDQVTAASPGFARLVELGRLTPSAPSQGVRP